MEGTRLCYTIGVSPGLLCAEEEEMPTARRAGNWFEENALETYTGVSNFDIKDKKMGTLTKNRCIEHTERTRSQAI